MSSVPFDEWDHWSASQIETFEMCNRKWWYNKRLKLKVPPTKDTNIGSAVHGEIERYFEDGDESKLGIIAKHGLPKLRELRARNPQIELSIGKDKRKGLGTGSPLITLAGLPGEGFIDVYLPFEVWDHKTTGQMKYAKTADELRMANQLVLYARASQVIEQDFTRPVKVGHIVYLKVPPYGVRVTDVDLAPEHIESRIQVLDGTVSLMKEVADVRSEISVTPTWTACTAYGGCPFKDRCHSTRNINRLTQPPGTHMTLAEKLAAASAARNTPVAPPATTPVQLSTTTTALQAKLAATLHKPVTGVVPPDAPLHDVTPATSQVTETEPAPATEATGVRKPRGSKDAILALGWTAAEYETMSIASVKRAMAEQISPTLSPGTWVVFGDGTLGQSLAPAAEAAVDLDSKDAFDLGIKLGWSELALTEVMSDAIFAKVITERLPAAGWDLSADGNTLAEIVQSTPVVEPVQEPKATRTRKPKTVTEVTPPVENTATDAQPEDSGAPPAPAVGGLILLIDVVALRGDLGPVTPLEDWYAGFADTVAKHNNVPHYSVVDQYNGGLKQVVGLIAANVPASGVFSVDTRLPLSASALEILLPYATMALRGVR